MTDEARWLRVKALFQEAVERPAAERAAFLAAAAGEDDALRGDVEALLAADAQAGNLERQFPVHDLTNEIEMARGSAARAIIIPVGRRLAERSGGLSVRARRARCTARTTPS
jgi:hypothetical protein